MNDSYIPFPLHVDALGNEVISFPKTVEDDGVSQYETQAMLEAGYDPEKPVHNGRFWA